VTDTLRIDLGAALALGGSEMSSARPITSREWLARVGLIVALGAGLVVIAASCDVGGLRLAALALSSFVFAVAYVLAPTPGKPERDVSLRPIVAMRVATLVAAAATGGFASPLVPILPVPAAMAWTVRRPGRRDVILAVLALALLVPVTAPTLRLASVRFAVLAGYTAVIAIWAVGRRIAELLDAMRAQSGCLSRIREGALVDAASRRRGLESMTTKLAHELKNPLAAIKSLAQIERARAGDDRAQRRLDVVLGETERIGAILREYLELARPVEEARVATVQLDELMADVAALLAGRAEAAGVALAVQGQGGALHADARLLKEAIVNVVCNAIEATPRGGTIDVTYDRGDRRARIVVKDTGRGMTKDVAARVGTPYFTTREGGTGLGVVLARTAIAQHRGTLEYSSTPGAGTVATIALPVLA
jgi:signal transduction histidine kinase